MSLIRRSAFRREGRTQDRGRVGAQRQKTAGLVGEGARGVRPWGERLVDTRDVMGGWR